MLIKKRLVSLCLVYFFGSYFLEPLGLSDFIPYCLSAFLGLSCLAYCCDSESYRNEVNDSVALASGLVRVVVWVTPENRDTLKEFELEMRKKNIMVDYVESNEINTTL